MSPVTSPSGPDGTGSSARSGAYPVNCWYVAATSDEVTDGLLARQVLDRQLVLYRQRSGAVAALQDRCPHRALPLSRGQLVDDTVVCAYHGFTFAADGTCLRVPSQEHVPYDADVRAYPVVEDGPFVWVWPGDPRRVASVSPPKVSELAEPGWAVFGGVDVVTANYLLLHENALDRAHFPFVHPDRSHVGYLTQAPPLQVEVTETTVGFARAFPPGPLAQWQVEVTGLPAEGTYVQRERGQFVSPGLHVDVMDIEAPGVAADGLCRSVFVRAYTPLSTSATLVHWQVTRNFAQDSGAVTNRLRFVHEKSMAEDRPFLEEIQALRSAGDMAPDVNAVADAAAVRVHHIVTRMLREDLAAPRPGRAAGYAAPAG